MGARELLAELAGAGLTVAVDGDRLLVKPASKLTDDVRASLRAAKAEVLAALRATRPYKLPRLQAEACHATPWDEATCQLFTVRLSRFIQLGMDACDADDLAERLVLRDVEQDDRRVCVECAELTDSSRCRAAGRGHLPGVGRHYEPVPAILHRCPAFVAAIKSG